MGDERLLAAAQQVLDADESARAADDLCRVVRDLYPEDPRVAELLETLAAYVPDAGAPGPRPEEVRTVIRETIARLF